jgi:hypothetical protein
MKPDFEQEQTEKTEKKNLRFLCYLLLSPFDTKGEVSVNFQQEQTERTEKENLRYLCFLLLNKIIPTL